MKLGHDINVNQARRNAAPGGDMAAIDPVAQGRVQILECPEGNDTQAMAALDELVRLSDLIPDWTWSRAAIISRHWDKLAPVRDFAESRGIPVEFANKRPLSLWKMREMQMFIEAVRVSPEQIISSAYLTGILNTVPSSRWTDRIGEGLGLLAREIDGRNLTAPDVIEWFAEWAHDSHGEQRGLKLLTAHRAKGLEFDDLVILDGGWERPSQNEDPDAPRRLFYVAMTRARRNLIVMSNDNHEYLTAGSPAIINRNVTPELSAFPGPRRFYLSAEACMVDLGFAGHLPPKHQALEAIAQARVGDLVVLVHVDKLWELRDSRGCNLGKMSRNFTFPAKTRFARGEIAAILRWRKEYGNTTYDYKLKRDAWEVVIPELVFEAL